MKRLFLISSALISCIFAFAQDLEASKIETTVEYREESELISVVAHLAGVPGYVWDAEEDEMYEYAVEVDSIFVAYKKHNAVQLAKELTNHGFAWNVPNAISLQYNIVEGKIVKRTDLRPEDDYYEKITHKNEDQLLRLLQKFYDDTNFHQFFVNHKALYTSCEEAMRKVVDQIDFNWYNTFFGTKEKTRININVGLLNGPGNFAALQHGDDNLSVVNALMGCCGRDKNGNIYYGVHYTLPVILHECNHSYCNPLNEEYWDEIKDNATKLFNTNPKFYTSIAYGNPLYLMNETFVEACVIRYMMSHDIDLHGHTIEDFIKADEKNKKFLMIRDVINVLDEREKHPEQYKTMRDFMPRYVEAVNNY